jgi:hypothetical protein
MTPLAAAVSAVNVGPPAAGAIAAAAAAAQEGIFGVIRLLAGAGARFDARDFAPGGWNRHEHLIHVLLQAARTGDVHVIEALLAWLPSFEAPRAAGCAALGAAAAAGDLPAVTLLLTHGADPLDSRASSGWRKTFEPPLLRAARTGHADCITALMVACESSLSAAGCEPHVEPARVPTYCDPTRHPRFTAQCLLAARLAAARGHIAALAALLAAGGELPITVLRRLPVSASTRAAALAAVAWAKRRQMVMLRLRLWQAHPDWEEEEEGSA